MAPGVSLAVAIGPAGVTTMSSVKSPNASSRGTAAIIEPRREIRVDGLGHASPARRREARTARHQHDPYAVHRRRAGGQQWPPGRADGRRANGVCRVDAIPPPRPDPPGLVWPRPLRAVERPRQHAAVLVAPLDRLRPATRRAQALPPIWLANARPSGIRPHA